MTIETARLALRPFREDDIDAYAALCADPEVMRFVGRGPLSREDAWRQMAMLVGHWQLRGYGMWAVEERASGALIGRIGCHFPEGWPDIEVSWVLARRHWGKGYGLEGASAAVAYAFTHLDREHIVSLIHPANARSLRLAERLGESVEGEMELRGHTVLVYGLTRHRWARPEQSR